MKVEIVDNNPEDLNYIIDNMRKEDIEEVTAAQGIGPAPYLRNLRSDEAQIGKVDGVPVCIFGVAEGSLISGGGVVWLLATDDLFKHKLAFLRRNRKWIKEKAQQYGRLSNYVDARNTDSVAWLKWLGFEIEEAVPYGAKQLPFHRFSLGE